jgi:hypothetical protein
MMAQRASRVVMRRSPARPLVDAGAAADGRSGLQGHLPDGEVAGSMNQRGSESE